MTNDVNIDLRTKEGRAMKAGAATGKETSAESLARAEARIRAIRGNPDLASGTERDKYWAPPPPDGFDYQWKLKSVLNQDDIDRIRQNEMNGWEAVPVSRHPELMPKGWAGNTIEVGGLVLMERPMQFTVEARADEARAAREAILVKEAQMREGRSGDLGRRQVNTLNKSRSPIAVPGDE